MKAKIFSKKLKSNVIPFNKIKKKSTNKNVSSTIAAIIAVNVIHPENISPEDFFINKIENNNNFEIVAFEDALEEIFENNDIETQKNSKNFINDAWCLAF